MPAGKDRFTDCSTGDLAGLLNVTERQVQHLVQQGLPHTKSGRAYRFDLRVAIPWIREMDRKPGGAREEVDRERALTLRRDREIKEGLYVEATFFDAMLDWKSKTFVDVIMGIPPRMKPYLDPEQMDRLFDEVSNARIEAATRVELGDMPSPMGDDTEAAPEADSEPVGRAGKKTPKRQPRARSVPSK